MIKGYSFSNFFKIEAPVSKKSIGRGKIAEAKVVLDLINDEVIKCDLPNVPKDVPYENVFKHYQRWYADVINEFVNS